MKKKPAGAGSIPERHCHGRHSAVSGSDNLTEGMRGSGTAVELPPSPAGHPGLQRDVGCGSCLQQPCALEFQERSFSSELTHTHTRLELEFPWLLQTIPVLPKVCPGLKQRNDRWEIFPLGEEGDKSQEEKSLKTTWPVK